MHTVVFSDRDGTINRDENYYLGTNKSWKRQISFLEGVVGGIKQINNIPYSHFFILTNQSGVALKGGKFDEFTIERMYDVHNYILGKLKKEGLNIDGSFVCPYIDLAYVKKTKEKKLGVHIKYVRDNHPDLKPNPGMAKKALASLLLKPEDCRIFMIGDRISDVKLGINAGGTGILVEGFKSNETGDKEKVMELVGNKYVAKNFLDAAEYIVENSK